MPTSTPTPALRATPLTTGVAVFMDKYCHGRIVDLIDARSDGREAGGYLVGRVVEDDRLEIVDHFAAAQDAQRSYGYISLDIGDARQRLADGNRDGRDQILGDYHSHPEPDVKPSPADRLSAFRCMEILGLGAFASLILTMRRNGSWQTTTWITRRDDAGRAITEPGTLLVSAPYG